MSEIKAADIADVVRESLGDIVTERVRESIAEARKANEDGNALLQAHRRMQQKRDDDQAKSAAGRYLRCLVMGKGSTQHGAEIAKRQFGDEIVAKALGESTFVDGGAVVPPAFAGEIIEYLRAKTVVRALGAREVPMPNGSFTMPYANTGTTAYATAENSNAAIGQPAFAQLVMTAKKLLAIVPVSNDLLSDASPQADKFLQDDMGMALKVLEDANFLRGSGTANTVRGLRFLAGSTTNASNAAASAGGSTTSEKIKDLVSLMAIVEGNNIDIDSGGWVLAPRTKYDLMALRDSQGNFYFKDEMAQGRLLGWKYAATTSMPINLNIVGSLSSKESEICFADFNKVLIGNTGELSVQAYLGGSYYDGSVVQSGISQDQTVITGKIRSDIAARFRGAEICWLQGVTWGV